MKRVADLVVETLQEAGVKHCYGIVGDTLNYITDAIARSKIQWVHMRHEEAGAFAAGAEALMTGELTACAGSCGPGGLHFINGLFDSNRNRAPVVLIASQIVRDQRGMDFPQEVDFKAIYSHCSVFCEEAKTPEQAQRLTAMACQAALQKRGVAVVILPADVSAAKINPGPHYHVTRPNPVIRPSDDELKAMAALLTAGKKVTIYAGSGVQGAHDELVELARKLNAPVGHSTRAKDFVAYDNPYNMGMTGMMGSKSGFEAMAECDTLLLLGTDFAFSQFYPGKAKIIQVDCDAAHLGRRYPIDLGIAGTVKDTLQALLPLIEEKKDDTFLKACVKIRDKALSDQEKEEKAGKTDLIHPQHLIKLLSTYADEDAFVTGDGGTAMVWVMRHFAVNGKRRTLASLLHGTMANAMPQALGLQKAFPDRQVIAVCGDGGLAMLIGDMLTAIQEKLPVKLVVLNNASLNFVELEQKVEGLVDHYTDLLNPDFAKLAEVVGFKGFNVKKQGELETAVKEFLSTEGPALLDVKTSGYELVMPAKVEMSQVANTALYGVRAVLEGRSKDVKNLLIDNFIK